jgi:hypothetical protein
LLAWALVVIITFICSASLYLAFDAVRKRFRTPESLLKNVSGQGSTDQLEKLFHWEFDNRLSAHGLSRDMWKAVQKQRINAVRKCLRAIRQNIGCFESMARAQWEGSAVLFDSDADQAKDLAAEMIHRAARCRALLKYVELRFAVTTLCDFALAAGRAGNV